jgi:ADP-heptose:LPS heptosyltransferase
MLLRGPANVQVELRGGHRLFENDRLADAIGLDSLLSKPRYLVPHSWRRPRRAGLLGVHPGTMVYKGNEARRWPFERFIELVRTELSRSQVPVRVFFGPNEHEDRERFTAANLGDGVDLISEPLQAAAAFLSECEYFVGNDAGFSHLAAGLGVKTLALFGMTNPNRAIPVGPAIALRPSNCPPCHDEGMGGFPCVRDIGFRCLNEDLPVSRVLEALEDMRQRGSMDQSIQESGPYRLYGKNFTKPQLVRI